ncbi:MAG: hypothetical protein WCR21_12665, partial [Bacteroidota bacterium]
DQKLWTALSCPTEGLEIDEKTLTLIDLDADGRIRVPEILEAVKWITSHILHPDELLKQSKSLPLQSINQNNQEGKNLYNSAKQILKNLNLAESQEITVSHTSDLTKIFANTAFNGDGIITVDSTKDADLKKCIQQIIQCCDAVKDRSGKKGIHQKHIEAFYEACEAYTKWQNELEKNKKEILPFGENTLEALKSYEDIQLKMNDYFIRLKLLRFDDQAGTMLNPHAKQIEAISTQNLTTCANDIANLPLSKISELPSLHLKVGINPFWESKIHNFYHKVIVPCFGEKEHLTEADWILIGEKFTAYNAWMSAKAGESVENIGLSDVQNILKNNQKAQLDQLIEQDLALETEVNNIILVDKLVRYYCDIFRLLKNFVTFFDFYSPDEIAIFQNGTLFIDQRSCALCIKVSDMDKHSSMVALSGMFLIYCECHSKRHNEKMTIVAAMTNGDIDNLIVGRNAIYYDRNGDDWDATVIKIVDNPISIRQAFFTPYRKVAKFIESQVEKFAQAKEKEGHEKNTANIENTASQIVEPPKAPPTPFDIGKFVGIFAAISLALGAIGGVLASFISGFLSLTWWKMPLALMGIVLAISGPSMIIAWLKLRKRNLAPILDANGWAINARAIINIPFGNTLTDLVKLPLNAKINLNDPFTKKKNPLVNVILILLILLFISSLVLWKMGI